MPGQKFETKQRITVRNLRIREDTAKVSVMFVAITDVKEMCCNLLFESFLHNLRHHTYLILSLLFESFLNILTCLSPAMCMSAGKSIV